MKKYSPDHSQVVKGIHFTGTFASNRIIIRWNLLLFHLNHL